MVLLFLFISGCEGRAYLTYLTYVMTTNQHIYPSATHSRHSFIILAFSYTFTVLIFSGFLPLSTKKMWKLSFVQVWRPNSLLMRMFSTKSFFLQLISNLFFSFFALGKNNRVAADRYFARFVGEESYSKGQSKKYLIPDVGPSWCIDPCKLRTEQK